MNRRLVTIVMALVLSGLGSLAVLGYVRGADERALKGQRSVQVMVAAKAIPGGTAVSRLLPDGYAVVRRFPAVSVPGDVLTGVDESDKDLILNAGLKAGELIRRPLLVQRGDSQAFTIPDGKIAVTVELGHPQQVAGYLKVGSKVAVFLSRKILLADGRAKGEATESKLLMSGVEVLSVSAAPAKEGDETKDTASTGKNLITLAVTQRQAEKLVWSAGQQGGQGLYLGLEGGSSELDEDGPGITSFKIFT